MKELDFSEESYNDIEQAYYFNSGTQSEFDGRELDFYGRVFDLPIVYDDDVINIDKQGMWEKIKKWFTWGNNAVKY